MSRAAVQVCHQGQLIENEVLEDFRLLTSYRMDSDNRLCLMMVGLTELRRRLSMAVHEFLADEPETTFILTFVRLDTQISQLLSHALSPPAFLLGSFVFLLGPLTLGIDLDDINDYNDITLHFSRG